MPAARVCITRRYVRASARPQPRGAEGGGASCRQYAQRAQRATRPIPAPAGRPPPQAAATLMGIDQPPVSHILHGRQGAFSTQRLINFLTALGRDVDIVV
ncbi:MAG: XRE family transcriptional regulator, partial [Gemmatimonadaceae bacterium]